MHFHHLPYLSDPMGWLFVAGGLIAIGIAAYIEYLRVRHRREKYDVRSPKNKCRSGRNRRA